MEKYNHKEVEQKWQKKWEEEGAYATREDSNKPKSYILDMYPYPSGAGLHVGHPKGYIGSDVVARFRRMNGHNVLHPIGWDAFGLPAENYAIKTGVPPQETTDKAIANFKSQIKSINLSYDWSREIGSHTPEYYKWTQWFFLLLYNNGLAYKKKANVNWCEHDKTVLANEQVEEGLCERCKNPVVQKDLEQWFFKITEFADDLIDDLDQVDWPHSTVLNQRNWIGRSNGATITFSLIVQPQYKEILLATNNKGKIARVTKLLAAAKIDVTVHTPGSLGIEVIDVEENGTLEENAIAKARAYADAVDMPVLANDTSLIIDGEDLDPVKVKRNALDGEDEKNLTQEQIAEKLLMFYKNIARKNDGEASGRFYEKWALALPDGSVQVEDATRELILTDVVKGEVDPYFPIRSLYRVGQTGKYVSEQSDAEELIELGQITNALKRLLTHTITVFTTRPDTLFGTTYLVLSPEHPWIEQEITNPKSQIRNKSEIQNYKDEAAKKTEIERTGGDKEKTGVKLEGVSAVNPANGEEIPVYIADYVLAGYGTGAIMAVPGHDERDYAFASQKNAEKTQNDAEMIEIRQVVAPYTVTTGSEAPRSDEDIIEFDAATAIVKHWSEDKYFVVEFKNGQYGFVGGHIEEGENPEQTVLREVAEESGYTDMEVERVLFERAYSRGYKSRKDREEFCHDSIFVVKLKSGTREKINDHEVARGEWKTAEDIIGDENIISHFRMYLSFYVSGERVYTRDGLLVNSESFNRMSSEEAKKKITEYVGGKMTKTYKLRDWLISRQRYWGAPIPIVYDPDGNPHPVPQEHLPWMLPTDVAFKPTGISPLADSAELKERTEKIFGKGWTPEVDTMDTFVCSSWYFFRFTDPHNDEAFASKEATHKWLPVDLYVGGAEHTVLHLMYARFFTKVLKKYGYVDFDEPFMKLRHQGLIMAEDGRKMSKSLGNVINPDEIVERYGADTLRVYEMFMGPFDQAIAWSTDSMVGARRFVERMWKLQDKVNKDATSEEGERLLHQTIKKVTEDIEKMHFNTAIAQLMTLLNVCEKQRSLTKEQLSIFVQLCAPFAPHIAEELWHALGHKKSVHLSAWPHYDEAKLACDVIELVVQVNGKVRDKIMVSVQSSERDAEAQVLASEKVVKFMDGKKPKKIIHVPGRLVNIVI